MEQKRGLILVLAILSLSIILIGILVNPLKEAYALQFFETSPAVAPIMIRNTAFNTNNYIVTAGLQSGSPFVQIYNATTSTLINTINVTSAVGFQSGATLRGLSCSPTKAICALAYTDINAIKSDRVFLLDVFHGYAQNVLTAGATYTTFNLKGVIYATTAGAQDQIYTIYQDGVSVKVDNWIVPLTSNQSAFQSAPLIFGFQYNTGFANTVLPKDFELGYFNTTNTPSSTQQFLAFTASSSNLFAVINIGARSTKCQTSVGLATSTADIQYLNDTANGVNNVNGLDWIVGSDTSIQTFVKLDNSCNLKTTYNSAGMIQTNYNILGIGASNTRHEIYWYAGGSKLSLIVVNASKVGANADTTFVKNQFQASQLPALINTIASSDTSNGMVAVAENSKIYWLYWTAAGQSSGSPTGVSGQQTFVNAAGQTCVNIYDSTGTVLITTYCSTSNSGGHIISPNTISSINTGSNITTLGNVLGCGLGLTSCTNSNIQTNGVGLFLLLILIVFSYALLVGIHYKAVELHSGRGNVQAMQVLAINPMLLLIMLIVDVGIAFFVNWISGIIFYTMVAAIAGLTTFGIYRHVKGDSS